MPVTFCPAPVFDWAHGTRAPAPRASAPHQRAPQQPRRQRPAPSSRPSKKARLKLRTRTILQARLERATAKGRLNVDAATYAAILHALFPEDFPGELPQPRESTRTPPQSVDRVSVYAGRFGRKEALYHPADLDAVADDRVALLGRMLLSGRGHQITGVVDLDGGGEDEEGDERYGREAA